MQKRGGLKVTSQHQLGLHLDKLNKNGRGMVPPHANTCAHMHIHRDMRTDIHRNLAKLSSWVYCNKTWNLSTLTLLWKFNYVVLALLDLGLECVNAQESDWDKLEGKRRWMKSQRVWCHSNPWHGSSLISSHPIFFSNFWVQCHPFSGVWLCLVPHGCRGTQLSVSAVLSSAAQAITSC